MREAILAVYQDRKNLAATLKDTKTVVGTLERIMAVVIQLVFFFVYLLIWNVRTLLRQASPHACRPSWQRKGIICGEGVNEGNGTLGASHPCRALVLHCDAPMGVACG